MGARDRLTSWLETRGQLGFAAYAIPAAFGAYFCMYAVRKPFAAATWEGELWGVDLKIVLVIAQVIGYALSKLLGIRLVPEVAPRLTLPPAGADGGLECWTYRG